MKLQNLTITNIIRIENTTDKNTTLYNRALDQIIYCGKGFKCRANYIVHLDISFTENVPEDIENIIRSYFTLKGENSTENGLIKYIETISSEKVENIIFLKIEKFYAKTLPSGSVVTSDPVTIILEKDKNISI